MDRPTDRLAHRVNKIRQQFFAIFLGLILKNIYSILEHRVKQRYSFFRVISALFPCKLRKKTEKRELFRKKRILVLLPGQALEIEKVSGKSSKLCQETHSFLTCKFSKFAPLLKVMFCFIVLGASSNSTPAQKLSWFVLKVDSPVRLPDTDT